MNFPVKKEPVNLPISKTSHLLQDYVKTPRASVGLAVDSNSSSGPSSEEEEGISDQPTAESADRHLEGSASSKAHQRVAPPDLRSSETQSQGFSRPRQEATTIVHEQNPVIEYKQGPGSFTSSHDGDKGVLHYLMRKDLVTQGLTHFDDMPENYRAWKASLKNVFKHTFLTPEEELDLLVKWTGTRSSAIVKKIRSVHINNPTSGLRLAWDRLDETFGAPEVITDALLKTARNFPSIGPQDNIKLREFSDLLLMLEAAKEELPALSYLDTHLGVNELALKLPYGLQTRWRSKGKEYKTQHDVPFPPFSFFMSFVRSMADEINDPSFQVSVSENGVHVQRKLLSGKLMLTTTMTTGSPM